MTEDLVEVELKYFFNKSPVCIGKMSAELVGKLNRAFAIERGCQDTFFEVRVKKSCQAVTNKAERKNSNANRKK